MGTVCQHDIVLHIVCTFSSTGASTMQISGLGSTRGCHQITTLSMGKWGSKVLDLGEFSWFSHRIHGFSHKTWDKSDVFTPLNRRPSARGSELLKLSFRRLPHITNMEYAQPGFARKKSQPPWISWSQQKKVSWQKRRFPDICIATFSREWLKMGPKA